MFARVSRRAAWSWCLVALITTNLVAPMPTAPPKRASEPTISRNGFSDMPRLLEIQLPLRIATRDDLVAWAKYVMSLMASKINITLTTVKDVPTGDESQKTTLGASNLAFEGQKEKPLASVNFPGPRIIEANNLGPFSTGEMDSNFVLPRSKETSVRSPFDANGNAGVVAVRARQPDVKAVLNLRNSPRTRQDQQNFLPQYPNFGTGNTFELRDNEIPRNASDLASPPSGMYLPLPVKTDELASLRNDEFLTRYFFDGVERNISDNLALVNPAVLNSRRAVALNVATENMLPLRINSQQRNASSGIKPILTLPFEAVITITKGEGDEAVSSKTETDNYFVVPTRNPPDDFPPYFEKNYTLTNESGQINVVFDDSPSTSMNKMESTEKEGKKKESKKKVSKKQKSRKRQATALSELLRMLAILRDPSSNSTDPNAVPPILKFLRGTNPQKAKIAVDNQRLPGRERRNETSQAQEIEEEDEDTSSNIESDEDDDDYGEEGMGGSIQALIELLPLVAPILEDLSDPESDTDIAELLQAAIPILEDLSQPGEDGEGVDLPGILVPILMNIIGGRDGQGSDPAALLGPLIQLLAPLIGPIIGPLIGPLSRQSNSPPGEGGSSISALVKGIIGPLSEPAGPGKISPISSIIAGVTASLSKEIASGKSGIDLSALVKSLVSGVIAGASSGLSAQKDSAVAPTSYGGYGGYGPTSVPANSVNPIKLIGTSIKDILNAGVKVASSLVAAFTGILGASSQDQPRPSYGPPSAYGTPPPYVASTSAPYIQPPRAPKRQSTRP